MSTVHQGNFGQKARDGMSPWIGLYAQFCQISMLVLNLRNTPWLCTKESAVPCGRLSLDIDRPLPTKFSRTDLPNKRYLPQRFVGSKVVETKKDSRRREEVARRISSFMAGSDPHKLLSKADKLTKLSLTRWSADWKTATGLYEQAGNGFRVAKDYERAKAAYEKASKGQEMLSSPWDAAKHMESAAALAKELSNWREVSDFYRRASELYIECGRSQPASDALAKGARALEDAMPEEAIQLYTDACSILEEDGKEQMAFDLYRAATSVYIKLEKYADAATFLLRLGLAADQCNATNSQCKAYLSAIIVYLYAHDFKQAEKCYNDCYQIDAFVKSDQNRCASKLLAAYTEGDIEEIKRIAQSSTISHLDHVIIRLARKLPTGDVSALKAGTAGDDELLDENDLT